jgi:hypothetical protein
MTQTGIEPLDEVNGIKGVNAFKVFSMPYPIHTAQVSKAHEHALWVVRLTSVRVTQSYRFALHAEAEKSARDIVGRLAGRDMQRYSRGQRMCMGQQLCPRFLRPGVLCGQPAGIGTVWCDYHPRGEARPDV